MDANKLIDEYLASGIAEETGKLEEKSRFFCELLLNEFKKMTPEYLSEHLKDASIPKKDPALVLTFSFPVTFNPPS